MSDIEVHSDMVEVSEHHDPIVIQPEDHEHVRKIQVLADSLMKRRQEIGRLYQVLSNMVKDTDETEQALAGARRDLSEKYTLEKYGTGQWAVDFEKKEFVKLSEKSPVIP
jgi:hypothetical protein